GSAINRFLQLATGIALVSPVIAAGGAHASPESRLYTVRDFSELARGVTPGLAGDFSIWVWAPSQDAWSQTLEKGTITLHYRLLPGDPTPRWQSLGKVSLSRNGPLKIVVSVEPAKSKSPESSKSSKAAKSDSKEPRKPGSPEQPEQPSLVPALLWLSAGIESS